MTFQAFLLKFIVCLFFSTTTNGFVTSHFIERSLKSETTAFRSTSDSNHFDNDDERNNSKNRRLFVNGISLSLITSLGSSFPKPAFASSKSRTEGYKFQKLDNEWKSQLTERQYDVLRNGGTERPYTSILESEERAGIYSCAGCGTNLFDSKEKFHSGTGWPSFASALEGVETEKVNFLQSNLAGAEIRCATCGGHLGDVFNDGFLFVGTPAAVSGKRFCVDGAALVFRSQDGTAEVIGDEYPPRKVITYY